VDGGTWESYLGWELALPTFIVPRALGILGESGAPSARGLVSGAGSLCCSAGVQCHLLATAVTRPHWLFCWSSDLPAKFRSQRLCIFYSLCLDSSCPRFFKPPSLPPSFCWLLKCLFPSQVSPLSLSLSPTLVFLILVVIIRQSIHSQTFWS
jgi:hypothetical protein